MFGRVSVSRSRPLSQVKRSRSKGGLAGPDGTKSVFGQMCAKMISFSPDSLLLPHRVWKVKFVGKYTPKPVCNGMSPESKHPHAGVVVL